MWNWVNKLENIKIDYINEKLNEIFTTYLAVTAKYNYRIEVIDYITNHIIEELKFNIIEDKVSSNLKST
ncbi:hypothetical protein [Caloranaerobacter ferrireducens]|uniref:hypothetical protein n=1 Tax=Caloranaerobacter ferrireducens TaxID=1323370 RepID=UPI00084D056F|nr:hypothetical protein [Caloranaerobacter ferrireducens]